MIWESIPITIPRTLWVIRVLYMSPDIFGVMGPGFLNQVPTVSSYVPANGSGLIKASFGMS